jgi:hypothetical protein
LRLCNQPEASEYFLTYVVDVQSFHQMSYVAYDKERWLHQELVHQQIRSLQEYHHDNDRRSNQPLQEVLRIPGKSHVQPEKVLVVRRRHHQQRHHRQPQLEELEELESGGIYLRTCSCEWEGIVGLCPHE